MIRPIEALRRVLAVVYICPVCKKEFAVHEDELAHYRKTHTRGIYDTNK